MSTGSTATVTSTEIPGPATSSSTSSTTETPELSRSVSTKNTKRKFDNALLSLDETLRPLGEYEFPSSQSTSSPSKKARLTRSIYSTLAKYGISSSPTKSKAPSDTEVLKSTPHLAAILARASRSRKAIPFKIPSNPFSKETPSHNPSSGSSTIEYRPSSTPSFLNRLSTFKLSTYSNKPASIDAVAAAKCGWINEGGKDRLFCGICQMSWVVVKRDGLSRDAANTLLEKQRGQLVSMHKDGCPWKSRQCDSNIYRIPLKPPASLAKEVKLFALQMSTVLDGVEIKHPLTSNQLQSLMSTISSIKLYLSPSSAIDSQLSAEDTQQSESDNVDTRQPSETAVLVALFGWSLVPPSLSKSTSKHTPQTPSPSNVNSRASSIAPGSSAPSTPTSTSRFRLSSLTNETSPDKDTLLRKETDSRVLHCILCQRRVGLWAFYDGDASNGQANATISTPTVATTQTATQRSQPHPKRQFDLIKEHRSYCPYIIRSTTVPSLPTPLYRSQSISQPSCFSDASSSTTPTQIQTNGDFLEGWRAVLSVILRHGLRQKQRQRALNKRFAPNGEAETNSEVNHRSSEETQNGDVYERNELDNIQAMVDDVKSHGGRDLLKYVRSLLT